MKNFNLNLIFLSFFALLIKLFLPKGEKSPLYPPLKLLISFCMILCIFSPIFPILKGNAALPDISFEENKPPDGGELIFNRLEEKITESIKKAFPESDFSLQIERNESMIPETVLLSCHDEKEAQNIKDYIKIQYQLKTKILER